MKNDKKSYPKLVMTSKLSCDVFIDTVRCATITVNEDGLHPQLDITFVGSFNDFELLRFMIEEAYSELYKSATNKLDLDY
jgi:hypothetical protein